MVYVVHFCKNRDCNEGWIGKDLTNAKTNPPQWKYCQICVENGYPDLQRPLLSEKQKERMKKMSEARLK